MDIETAKKIIRIGYGGFEAIYGRELPCPACGINMDCIDGKDDPHALPTEVVWECPYCGRNLTGEDVDCDGYIDKLEMANMMEEVYNYGEVYNFETSEFEKYSKNDPRHARYKERFIDSVFAR